MAKWVSVGTTQDFKPNDHRCVTANGVPVVVFADDEGWRAIANVCPHAGLPLGDGERRGKVITCPFHGYTYNIETGQNIDFPEHEPPVRTFPIRCNDDGGVEVDLDPASKMG